MQYFVDPTAARAKKMALGRMDLPTLIDPFVIEMYQDYDCSHSSNPSCDYKHYGALCSPHTRRPGDRYLQSNYGSVDPTW